MQTAETPEPPEAPAHWGNSEASAWQSGWSEGFEAGVKAAIATLVRQQPATTITPAEVKQM